MSGETFDYIVVGAGSAGATLAARLSEDPTCRVLLLEAGEDDRWIWLRIPAGLFYVLRGDRAIWRFQTEPDAVMHGRRIFWPRGKVLGGSSGINGMIWVHGDPKEFDHWRDAYGLTGWGFDDLQPFFKSIECYPTGDPKLRGQNGPVRITEFNPREPLMEAFIDACEASGVPRVVDYNNGSYHGVGMLQFNTSRGLRVSTREAYLRPIQGRANLVVRTGALTERVQFEGRRASGVAWRANGQRHEARARREVILCAGALQSPQLLELSGIGDPDILAAQGISVLHAQPAVGTNLRDHPHTRISYRIREDVQTLNALYPRLLGKARMALRLLLAGNGLMSCSGQIAHALAKSLPDLQQADIKIQLHWLSSPDARDPRNLVLDQHAGISIGTFMLRPQSRGTIHIQSPDPAQHPKIHSNYFTDPEDRRTAIAAVRLARQVAQQPALAAYQLAETRPGADAQSDDEIFTFITRTAQTSYHPIGSCRMGGDAASVVDERLRVRGVEGLRVADASVMPTMCSANTNAPSIVIGEKAARMIIQDAR